MWLLQKGAAHCGRKPEVERTSGVIITSRRRRVNQAREYPWREAEA
jgi:hypothetical protein